MSSKIKETTTKKGVAQLLRCSPEAVRGFTSTDLPYTVDEAAIRHYKIIDVLTFAKKRHRAKKRAAIEAREIAEHIAKQVEQ